MKKLIALFAGVFALVSFKAVAQNVWTVDPTHSKLAFTVTHMMVSDVEGSFKNFSAKITSGKDDFSDASIELSADVASINTDNDQRDAHLKSPDFFDAANNPKITFKSTSFKKIADKTFKITGSLTMHGVTKPVTLDATFRGIYNNPMSKKTTAGFKVTGTLKRTDFGIGTKYGNAMVSDEVTLSANGEFTKN